MELEEAQAYASGWRVAWATRTGRWVATRIGGLTPAERDRRRYALFADDLDDLVNQIDDRRSIEREDRTRMTISSWSSIRYLLDDADQVEVSMAWQVARAITRHLGAALAGGTPGRTARTAGG